MRRTAAQQIRSLEMRIARLEKEAGLFDFFGDDKKDTLKLIAHKTAGYLVDNGIANIKGNDDYFTKKPSKAKVYQLEIMGHIRGDRQQIMYVNAEFDKRQDSLKVYLTGIYANQELVLIEVPNFSEEDTKFITSNIETIVKNSIRTPRQRQKLMALYQF